MTELERHTGLPPASRAAAPTDLTGLLSALPDPDAFVRSVLDIAGIAVVVGDADGVLTSCNSTAEQWFGDPVAGNVPPADRARHFGLHEPGDGTQLATDRLPLLRTLAEGGLSDVEVRISGPGRPVRLVRCDGWVLQGPDGRTAGAAVLLTDRTTLMAVEHRLRTSRDELAAAEQALAMSEERFRATFHHGPMAMCALDADAVISRVNPALRRLLAVPSARLIGQPLTALVAPADRNRLAVALAATGSTMLPVEPIEVRLQRPDGQRLWCEVGTARVADGVVHTLVSFGDVDDRKSREAHLERAAARDDLTGLTNRPALTVLLAELLAPSGLDATITVLFVDVTADDDPPWAGPERRAGDVRAGDVRADDVRLAVAGRLREAVREQDLVARVGADQFVVICQDLDGPAGAGTRDLVRRLHRALSVPVQLASGPCSLTPSVGATLAVPGEQPAAVLARAEAAYGRRGEVRSRPPAAQPTAELPRRPGAAPRLAELVDTAVHEHRLVVAYQPVVQLHTGTIVGAEALLRMYDREGLVIEPDAFIPLAETSGAIHGIGDWVLRAACRRAAGWKARLPASADFAIGVNLSPRQLDDPDLVGRVAVALADSGIDPAALVLELTERLLTTDTAHVRAQLEAIRDRGVRLAADDFGTGYCSVRYLVDLPLDIVKIDRSWTARLGEDSRSGRLADGVAQLARASGLVTIVEGVETEQERAAVLAQGLDLAQGYLFARPLTVTDFEARLFAS